MGQIQPPYPNLNNKGISIPPLHIQSGAIFLIHPQIQITDTLAAPQTQIMELYIKNKNQHFKYTGIQIKHTETHNHMQIKTFPPYPFKMFFFSHPYLHLIRIHKLAKQVTYTTQLHPDVRV